MPTLKIKPEFVAKLKAFGAYDKWKSNLITQWHYVDNKSGCGMDFDELQLGIDYFGQLLSDSFNFMLTPEGHDYWWKIEEQLDDEN